MKKYILIVIALWLVWPLENSRSAEVAWHKISTRQNIAMSSKYYHAVPDVVVGVVDGGIDYTHPDLQGQLWDGGEKYPHHGYDFTGPDNDPRSSNPHGTWVAGIIANMAPNAKIAALRAVDTCDCSFEGVFPALVKFAIAQKIKILNVSLGFSASKINSKRMQQTIQSYQDFGGLIVCSAGNKKEDNDQSPQFPCSFTYDCIISVAACDQDDCLAYFSNWGLNSVDIAAPGIAITGPSYAGKYLTGSGTSASTPMVSALAAYLWGVNPKLSAQEIKDIILQTATPCPNLEDKILTGGKINFWNAFEKAAGPIQQKYLCYKNVAITLETRINGWQQAIVYDLSSQFLTGTHTQIFLGDRALNLAKSEIDFWQKQNIQFKQCDCPP